jgi:hypothetical protein
MVQASGVALEKDIVEVFELTEHPQSKCIP